MSINSKHYGLIVGGQILRCSTAILSFLGSTTITIMILKSKKGLKTPYSRIIFGLSVADMMQSFGIFISPWASPKDASNSALVRRTTNFFFDEWRMTNDFPQSGP